MYKENFVASIKTEKGFLRDNKGEIEIPFNHEYSLYFKNLDSRKAVVSVQIDGKDVLDGNEIVVNGNSSTELLGEMIGSNVRNRFKFIEFTDKIEKHIGYNPEFSTIRIEYKFEKMKPIVQEIIHKNNWYDYRWDYPYYKWDWSKPCRWDSEYPITYQGTISTNNSTGTYTISNLDCNASNYTKTSCFNVSSTNLNNNLGITVKGNNCNQNFHNVFTEELEDQSHVITLRLVGKKADNNNVINIFTTREKKICSTCGEKNDNTSKFCKECGTFLE